MEMSRDYSLRPHISACKAKSKDVSMKRKCMNAQCVLVLHYRGRASWPEYNFHKLLFSFAAVVLVPKCLGTRPVFRTCFLSVCDHELLHEATRFIAT